MGVTRRWLTVALATGLVLFFIGERVFRDLPAARIPLSVSGVVAVLGALALRLVAWRRAAGEVKRIERLFALAYLGCALALLGFFVGTEEGVRFLGIEFEDPFWEVRFRRGTLSVSTILLVISALPTLAAQWAVREGEGVPLEVLPVRAMRIFETATAALTVALAGAFLMLAGFLAGAHNQTLDASYFKTSRPGSSIQEVVRTLEEPLRAVLFFPDLNPVGDEVATYFGELGGLTGNAVVERHDRLAEPWAAEEYDVQGDGVVILSSGDRSERIRLPIELDDARIRLRVFDGEAGEALLKLSRARRIAYLTVGHGELNDPGSAGTLSAAEDTEAVPAQLEALRRLLGLLNYESRDLGIQHGLADRVPDDAAMVLVIGPRRAFLAEELRALSEYLERGGSLLIAMEPASEFELGQLRAQLGVDFNPVTLADDQRHMRQQGGPADRRLIVTDRFSSHPAVTTASRQGVGAGILLMGAGHLTASAESDDPQPRFIMGSLSSTFADSNGNFALDEGESRESYDLAAAIEGSETENGTPRALVYSDAEMFSDAVLVNLGLNAAVAADGIRWLGEEEEFAGETTSEEDVPIVHTRSEDVAWFYAIILGAPALVLALGFLNGSLRRARRSRRQVVQA